MQAVNLMGVVRGSRWSEIEAPRGRNESHTVATGTVKFFNSEKGYGFISRDDSDGDIFVHFSQISGTGYRSLEEGQKVEFEVGAGRKGDEAQNVRAL